MPSHSASSGLSLKAPQREAVDRKDQSWSSDPQQTDIFSSVTLVFCDRIVTYRNSPRPAGRTNTPMPNGMRPSGLLCIVITFRWKACRTDCRLAAYEFREGLGGAVLELKEGFPRWTQQCG